MDDKLQNSHRYDWQAERIKVYERALRRIGAMEEPPYISAPGIALEALQSQSDAATKASDPSARQP
jgi:hypothetical protein